jgi:hypothetical protein
VNLNFFKSLGVFIQLQSASKIMQMKFGFFEKFLRCKKFLADERIENSAKV